MSDPLALYKPHRMQIQSGDMILWHSATILGWLIRCFHTLRSFKRVTVNHASLVVKGPEHVGSVMGDRRWQLEALWQGVVLRKLSDRLTTHKGKAYWYPLLDKYDSYRDKISATAYNELGTPYDYFSVFKQIYRRVKAGGLKLFCSELLFWVYRQLGIVTGKKAPAPDEIPGLGIHRRPVRIK